MARIVTPVHDWESDWDDNYQAIRQLIQRAIAAYCAREKVQPYTLKSAPRLKDPEIVIEGHTVLFEDHAGRRVLVFGPMGRWYAYLEKVSDTKFWQAWPLYHPGVSIEYVRHMRAFRDRMEAAKLRAAEDSKDGTPRYVVQKDGGLEASIVVTRRPDKALYGYRDGQEFIRAALTKHAEAWPSLED